MNLDDPFWFEGLIKDFIALTLVEEFPKPITDWEGNVIEGLEEDAGLRELTDNAKQIANNTRIIITPKEDQSFEYKPAEQGVDSDYLAAFENYLNRLEKISLK